MPFTLKDGSWYFEAVQFVPGRKRVHKANALAMCPLCAAREYKYVPRDEGHCSYRGLVHDASSAPGDGSVELPVLIAGKRTVLRLTGKHTIDLQRHSASPEKTRD